jgi:hypothetical protein
MAGIVLGSQELALHLTRVSSCCGSESEGRNDCTGSSLIAKECQIARAVRADGRRMPDTDRHDRNLKSTDGDRVIWSVRSRLCTTLCCES